MRSSKSGVITSSELMRKLYIVRLTQCAEIPGSSRGRVWWLTLGVWSPRAQVLSLTPGSDQALSVYYPLVELLKTTFQSLLFSLASSPLPL